MGGADCADEVGVIGAVEHVESGDTGRKHFGVVARGFGEPEVMVVQQVQRSDTTCRKGVAPYSGWPCIANARMEIVVPGCLCIRRPRVDRRGDAQR